MTDNNTSELTIMPDVKGDDPKHVAAMVAKADGLPPPEETPAGDTTERPAWLPEGFDTPEALAEAYRSLTTKKPVAPEAAPDGAETAVKEAVAKAGLDWDALATQVVQTGDLSETDYAALAEIGIGKELVASYLEGQRALGEQFTARLQDHVGGADALNRMIEWAGKGGLTPSEVEAFNRVIDNGDEGSIKLALDGLRAKYGASGQDSPRLIGGGRGVGAGDVYASKAELQADINNPAYSNDPAFRARVEAKLFRSDIF